MRNFLGRFIFYALVLPLLLLVFFNESVQADIVTSPTSIQFYIVKEQPSNPSPVILSAFSTTATTASSNSSTGGTTTNMNQTECMLATTNASWITVSPGTCASVTPGSANTFNVGIDITKLPIYSGTAVTGSAATSYTGTITLTDELETSNSSTGGTGSGTNTGLRPNGSTTVNVTVYIQSVKNSTGEMRLNTSDWLDLNLDIPITKDLTGALYVLVEHKSLAPGQTFAYRYDATNGPQFYYFSQWGQPVNNAQLLYYAADVHNTPIAIPFTSNAADGTIPYGQTDVVSTIPIRFGAGMRLIGMEGDMVIHVLIGDPNNIQNYASWRELLYYVLHIEPVTGTWTITEYYQGQPYTYTNYPLFLYEKRGALSGIWDDPHGRQQLYVSYGNPTDQVCTNSLAVQGRRFNAQGCEMTGGYQIYLNEPTAFGQIEYLYQITKLTGGSLSGEYMYRMLGDTNWSIPETFNAVRREVVIPLDPTTNSYQVNGVVNGYAVHFIVDTGAYTVLLDQNIAPYIGFTDLTTDPRCSPCGATVAGGATIQTTCCTVSNITVEGQLSKDNVSVAFGTQPGPALLGMSFLNSFHVSTDATDGTMTIAP